MKRFTRLFFFGIVCVVSLALRLHTVSSVYGQSNPWEVEQGECCPDAANNGDNCIKVNQGRLIIGTGNCSPPTFLSSECDLECDTLPACVSCHGSSDCCDPGQSVGESCTYLDGDQLVVGICSELGPAQCGSSLNCRAISSIEPDIQSYCCPSGAQGLLCSRQGGEFGTCSTNQTDPGASCSSGLYCSEWTYPVIETDMMGCCDQTEILQPCVGQNFLGRSYLGKCDFEPPAQLPNTQRCSTTGVICQSQSQIANANECVYSYDTGQQCYTSSGEPGITVFVGDVAGSECASGFRCQAVNPDSVRNDRFGCLCQMGQAGVIGCRVTFPCSVGVEDLTRCRDYELGNEPDFCGGRMPCDAQVECLMPPGIQSSKGHGEECEDDDECNAALGLECNDTHNKCLYPERSRELMESCLYPSECAGVALDEYGPNPSVVTCNASGGSTPCNPAQDTSCSCSMQLRDEQQVRCYWEEQGDGSFKLCAEYAFEPRDPYVEFKCVNPGNFLEDVYSIFDGGLACGGLAMHFVVNIVNPLEVPLSRAVPITDPYASGQYAYQNCLLLSGINYDDLLEVAWWNVRRNCAVEGVEALTLSAILTRVPVPGSGALSLGLRVGEVTRLAPAISDDADIAELSGCVREALEQTANYRATFKDRAPAGAQTLCHTDLEINLGLVEEDISLNPADQPEHNFNLCEQIPHDPEDIDNPETPFAQCFECESSGGVWSAIGCIKWDEVFIVRSMIYVGLSVSGGILLLIILSAAFLITTSRGDPQQMTKAKEMITSAIVGALFMVFSVTLIRFIGSDVLRIPGFGE